LFLGSIQKVEWVADLESRLKFSLLNGPHFVVVIGEGRLIVAGTTKSFSSVTVVNCD